MKPPSWIPRNRFESGSQSYAPSSGPSDHEKVPDEALETPVPFVTWRSLLLGAFVSIGGIIFGYDTGQISGFLEMDNFKRRFGQLQPDGTYAFNNVRSGLIVSMVRALQPLIKPGSSADLTLHSCLSARC